MSQTLPDSGEVNRTVAAIEATWYVLGHHRDFLIFTLVFIFTLLFLHSPTPPPRSPGGLSMLNVGSSVNALTRDSRKTVRKKTRGGFGTLGASQNSLGVFPVHTTSYIIFCKKIGNFSPKSGDISSPFPDLFGPLERI